MKEERIQKIIAQSGLCSRRAAETMIAAGRVKRNGRPVKLGDKMNPNKDVLSVDGQNIEAPSQDGHLYIMLYKPRGYLTTAHDELGRKTVMELVKGLPRRVYPVGRLDKESEGLLLFTSDGEFANLLTHPSHGVSKLYRVTVQPRVSEDQAAQLAGGVTLDDGSRTLPASVRVVSTEGRESDGVDNDKPVGRSVLEISIREGKNRQIRRMCEAVGLHILRLKRSAVGSVKLGMQKPGTWRELTQAEVNALKASALKATRKERD